MTDLDVRGASSSRGSLSEPLSRRVDGSVDGRVERRVGPDRLAGVQAPPTSAREQGIAMRSAQLVALLVLVDVTSVAAALAVAYVGRWGTEPIVVGRGISAWLMAVLVGVAWLATIAAQRGYEARVLGVGGEEYRRVLRATFVCFGVLAIASYVVKFELARGFVAIAFPLGLVLLLLGRFGARRWVLHQRSRGLLCHRVLVLGERTSVCDFVAQLRLEPRAGFAVVGACLPRSGEQLRAGDGVDVLGTYADVDRLVRELGVDVVAVTASESITPERLRRVAWSLEGLDVDLVVAPAVTDVAGPRLSVRPVAGLPLLYVDEPRFTGWQRLVKGTLDRVGSAVGLVVLSPLLLLVAGLVRATSPGPALFRQARTGLDGRPFQVLKFRTMVDGAEGRLGELDGLNEGDGLLFKIAADPRVTPLGRLLRRTSLDELPQLVNVLRGEMSLVGPRPLAVDADGFVDHEHRRHLVKPGMTGLWQVSARADQSWDDAVRLDLYYVENWSLAMDTLILLRTLVAAFRGH